jgi:hypothetical protein
MLLGYQSNRHQSIEKQNRLFLTAPKFQNGSRVSKNVFRKQYFLTNLVCFSCVCIRPPHSLQPRVVSDLLEPLVATGDNDVTINVAWALHHLGRAPVNLAPLLSGALLEYGS